MPKGMLLWFAFSVFVLVPSPSNWVTSQAITTRSPLIEDGDFIIQGMFPLTNSSGALLDNYVVGMEAMVYAIKSINDRQDILNSTRLGYEIVNDQGKNLHVVMEEAIRIVSRYRPKSTCRASEEFCTQDLEPGLLNKRVSAVVGPATSASTVPVASLLGLYSIPQVGYSASSSLLSEKSRFKSFLRTVPSDKFQAAAMVSFIKSFGWNYVFFVGSDDEYGREGLVAFKNAARQKKVCTADEINIAFNREDAKDEVRKVVEKIRMEAREVEVVVLFMFESQTARFMEEAKRQGMNRNITWILSDAVGRNIVNYGLSNEILNGAIAVDFVYEELPIFREHLENITVKSAENNPWMTKLLEKTLNCSRTTPVGGGKRRCKDDERLNLTRAGLTDSWSGFVNIINSVTAIAYGLDNLLKCKDGQSLLESGVCPNKTFPLNSKDLYRYIRSATFTGAVGKQVAFDENGDLVTKEYVFRNLVYDRERDSIEFRYVGNWSSKSPDALWLLTNITWNGGILPDSICSEACTPGTKQVGAVGQSDCCWACHPCSKGEISNKTSSTSCIKCPKGTYANDEQTECIKIAVDFVDASDPFSIIIITISCLGLVAMALVSLLFMVVKDTPLIQDSVPLLLGLFVLSTVLAFIFSIFQVSLFRNDSACRFLGAFLQYVVLLVSVTLLAKTQTCYDHLRLFTSHYLKPATHHSNLVMILASLLFELLLIGVWFLTDSPVVHFLDESKAVHLRECNSSWTAARFIATAFPLLVLTVATACAFKERDSRRNHKEAKYVSFCTISMCILLIAFFPTYRFVRGITTTIVIATTSLVGAFAVIGCIILPKVYILVFRPDSNAPEHERNSDPTVSSAHTAGSHHGSSGNHHSQNNTSSLCAETGEVLRTGSSSSGASSRDTDAVKDMNVK